LRERSFEIEPSHPGASRAHRVGGAAPALEVFTAPWAVAWGEALRASESYRRAAARWEGSLLMELGPDQTRGIVAPRAVLLDLWHGDCRAARLATGEDAATATYAVRGAAAVWQELLARRVEPLFALVAGRLRLERGSLSALTPFAAAARELVVAAASLEAEFPRRPEERSAGGRPAATNAGPRHG
jgi:putative sterol carrier protein